MPKLCAILQLVSAPLNPVNVTIESWFGVSKKAFVEIISDLKQRGRERERRRLRKITILVYSFILCAGLIMVWFSQS